jgi:integrase
VASLLASLLFCGAGLPWRAVRGTKRKKRDGIWEVRVCLGRDAATGNPRQLGKTVHGNARDPDGVLHDLIAKHGGGSTDGVGATFGQLLDLWLEECERLDRSPTTVRTYRSQIDKTVRPALGKVKVGRISARHLDDLYGAMKEQGRTAKTIRNHHAIFSSAQHHAVRWGWIRENVAERARTPQVGQRRVKAPSVESVRAVVAAAEERDPRLAPLLMLAALTGMRRGELGALRWSDVDLQPGELNVSRSEVVAVGGLAQKSTKTDRFRQVALAEKIRAMAQRARPRDPLRHRQPLPPPRPPALPRGCPRSPA